MRVLMLSKACIVGQYQTKLTSLAAKPRLDLTVVVPPAWRDERGLIPLERKHTDGYQLVVAPMRFNGHFHLHYYPNLPEILAQVRPDLLHIDEEPYNLATYLAAREMHNLNPNARILFFSWQNIARYYPPPFAWMEKYVYQHANAAIAGSVEAQKILRAKGFVKPLCVIPQFGVPDSFAPSPVSRERGPVTIGYAGRLVREKGIQVLMRAVQPLQGDWQLKILGSGPLSDSLPNLARELGIADRVQFAPWTASDQMPGFYNSLDILVVPSLTRPNWKEQFGRVIMEAMACGVPVVGSDSGEIPNVIGDAGIIVPENDPAVLTGALNVLCSDPARRSDLAARGRTRALALYSQQRVVDDTYNLYQSLVAELCMT
ncbi:MAG: glycosyltransferase [Anaerolineae bacterium]|nr:glycosyltransferase [Anaerolineae bacterium]